jgi:hypothetical protein
MRESDIHTHTLSFFSFSCTDYDDKEGMVEEAGLDEYERVVCPLCLVSLSCFGFVHHFFFVCDAFVQRKQKKNLDLLLGDAVKATRSKTGAERNPSSIPLSRNS